MMSPRSWAPLGASAVLTLLVAWASTWTAPTALGHTAPSSAVRIRARDVPELHAEAARPLFALARSNLPVDGPTATPPSPPPTLSGIVRGSGKAVALFKLASGDARLVHVGETIDGWTLLAITAREVKVEQGGQQQTITLQFGAPGAAPRAATEGTSTSVDPRTVAEQRGLSLPNIPHGSPLDPRH